MKKIWYLKKKKKKTKMLARDCAIENIYPYSIL